MSRPEFLAPTAGDYEHAAVAEAVAAHTPYLTNRRECPLCGRYPWKHSEFAKEFSCGLKVEEGQVNVAEFRVCIPCALLVSGRARRKRRTEKMRKR